MHQRPRNRRPADSLQAGSIPPNRVDIAQVVATLERILTACQTHPNAQIWTINNLVRTQPAFEHIGGSARGYLPGFAWFGALL